VVNARFNLRTATTNGRSAKRSCPLTLQREHAHTDHGDCKLSMALGFVTIKREHPNPSAEVVGESTPSKSKMAPPELSLTRADWKCADDLYLRDPKWSFEWDCCHAFHLRFSISLGHVDIAARRECQPIHRGLMLHLVSTFVRPRHSPQVKLSCAVFTLITGRCLRPAIHSLTMSFFTTFFFASLYLFSHVAAVADPCPECEAMSMQPPVVTKTEPCCECGECEDMMPTPAPVIVTKTEPCCECGECDEMPSTPAVLTSTISVCGTTSHKSILPYTSGSATFWMSSCVPSTLWWTPSPSTMWYTRNVTASTCAPANTVTLPGSTAISTTTSTVIRYNNGTAPPAQTVTVTATSLQGYTSTMYSTSDIFTTLPGVTVTGSTTVVSTTTSLTTGRPYSSCGHL